MKYIFKCMYILSFLLICCSHSHSEETKIKMGSIIYEDRVPIALLTKRILEKQGYSVELKIFSELGIAYASLSKGDIDIFTGYVNYVAYDYWSRYKNRLEKISPVSHGLYQSIVVPSYVPINSLEELNSISDQVGGKIIGIEPGSGLMRSVEEAIKAYDLNYKLVAGSTAAMVAELQSKLERKEPIVAMIWDPSWMKQKFDIKFLNDPKHVFEPQQTLYWLGTKGFSTNNPNIREIIASIYIPLEDVRFINDEMNKGKGVEEVVDEWMAANSDLIDRWLTISK